MNSAVRPVNSAWTVWTVFFVHCTVNSCDVTVHALGGKKKKKVWKRKRGFGNADPNPHLISRTIHNHIKVYSQEYLDHSKLNYDYQT